MIVPVSFYNRYRTTLNPQYRDVLFRIRNNNRKGKKHECFSNINTYLKWLSDEVSHIIAGNKFIIKELFE